MLPLYTYLAVVALLMLIMFEYFPIDEVDAGYSFIIYYAMAVFVFPAIIFIVYRILSK